MSTGNSIMWLSVGVLVASRVLYFEHASEQTSYFINAAAEQLWVWCIILVVYYSRQSHRQCCVKKIIIIQPYGYN